jgi:PKD repeat protein
MKERSIGTNAKRGVADRDPRSPRPAVLLLGLGMLFAAPAHAQLNADFTATPTIGELPLEVQFRDISTPT